MRKRISLILIVCCIIFSFIVPALAAPISSTGFSDVTTDAWYAEAVVYCRDNGLMSGITSTKFSPNSSISRAMLATILYQQAGSPATTQEITFADTKKNTWYSKAISWAVENNIVSGYTNGNFGPNDSLTREQFASTAPLPPNSLTTSPREL